MADQIVDQNGAAADPAGLFSVACQLRRFEVMREQAAAYDIETIIAKGKRESVGDQRAMAALQMGGHAVQVCNLQLDPFWGQLLACFSGHFSVTRSDFQKRELFLSGCLAHAFDHLAGRSDSTEPPVDPAEILEGGLDFIFGAAVGVQNLRGIDTLHSGQDDDSLDDGARRFVNSQSKTSRALITALTQAGLAHTLR